MFVFVLVELYCRIIDPHTVNDDCMEKGLDYPIVMRLFCSFGIRPITYGRDLLFALDVGHETSIEKTKTQLIKELELSDELVETIVAVVESVWEKARLLRTQSGSNTNGNKNSHSDSHSNSNCNPNSNSSSSNDINQDSKENDQKWNEYHRIIKRQNEYEEKQHKLCQSVIDWLTPMTLKPEVAFALSTLYIYIYIYIYYCLFFVFWYYCLCIC